MQDRCTVFMVEEAQVEAQFGLFGYSTNLDARLVHGLHGTYQMLGKNLEAHDGTPR